MVVLNEMDRFHLVMDVMEYVPSLHAKAEVIKALMNEKLLMHKVYIEQFGEDMPEITQWQWKRS